MAPGIGLQFGILVFVLLFKPSGGKTYVRLGHFIPGLSVGEQNSLVVGVGFHVLVAAAVVVVVVLVSVCFCKFIVLVSLHVSMSSLKTTPFLNNSS